MTAFRGARSLALAIYGARAITLVSLLIIARVLAPADFGIAALALLVGGTLAGVSDFGLSSTIVSYGESASLATFRRAARLRLSFSVIGFIFVFLAAGPIALLLGAPEAEGALRAMSFVLLIGASGFAPATGLASQRNFGALSWAFISMSLAQAMVTIVFAIVIRNYWAIVLGFLAGASTLAAVQWGLWRNRVWRGTDSVSGKTLLIVGGLLTTSWLSVAILFTADRIVVSTRFGSTQLGYYALAMTWGLFISDSLNHLVGAIATPTFAAMAEDRRRIGAAYLSAIRLVAFFAFPASIGLIFVAPELLVLILGGGTAKWLPSLAVLQIVSILGLLRSIVGPANSLLLATRTFARHAYLIPIPVIVFLLLTIPLAGYPGSIEGVAIALLFAYSITAALTLRAITRVSGLERWAVFKNIRGPAAATLLMAAALLPLRLVSAVGWISLAALVGAGLASYFGALLLLRRRAELAEFLDAANAVLGRTTRDE